MLEALSFGFMQRALIAGLFISVSCAVLGVFLILRRDAMIGHGLSHVTFGGVALGILLGVSPFAAAAVVSILSVVIMVRLREKAGVHGDTAIAILASFGMAVGIIIVSQAESFNVSLMSFLFGSILAIEAKEVYVSVFLAAIVVLTVVLFYQDLLYVTFDADSAKVSGVHAQGLEMLLGVLTAITVVLGMKVVGILLVASLLVIPSAAGLQVAFSFRQAVALSAVGGVVSVASGILLAFYLDTPASGAIVTVAIALFLLAYGFRRLTRKAA